MFPTKPGRGCARVDKRRVLQKITAPPNTRNALMCPSLPYMRPVQQPGQAKTVVPSSSCPFPARHQDAASIFDTLQPWRALWSCLYSGVAPLYQQLPAKGRRPAGGERKGPANTQGWRTHTGSQRRGESMNFLHALPLVWEATSLLDLRGSCCKVKATQKPMITVERCLMKSFMWKIRMFLLLADGRMKSRILNSSRVCSWY